MNQTLILLALFCDMGDSGHSSKGKGYHDDYCLAKIAKAYLEKWK